MPRNFFRRVEVALPVEEAKMREEIVQTYGKIFFRTIQRLLNRGKNGNYVAAPKRRKKAFTVQDHLDFSLPKKSKASRLKKVRSGRAPGESKNQGKTNYGKDLKPKIGSLRDTDE